MAKQKNIFFVLLLIIISTSCQAGNEQAILPTETRATETPNITDQAAEISETATTEVASPINFISELKGSLFIGSYGTGIYWAIDFDNQKTDRYKLPYLCLLLSNAKQAVCIADSKTNEVYIYDVVEAEKTFSFEQKGGWWMLTSSESLVEYAISQTEGRLIYTYDLEDGTSSYVGKFDDTENKFSWPQISNSGNLMIGLNHNNMTLEKDDSWFLVDTDSMMSNTVLVPENIVATYSTEWSPDDTMIAMIAFYKDDEIAHVGILNCEKEVLIYDPKLKQIQRSIKVPDGRCFTPTDAYPHHIWSPDSSKIALVLNNQDICVIELFKDENSCNLITNNYGTDDKFGSMAWSPDSDYLAFIIRTEILVYSINSKESYYIGNTKDLSRYIGGNLVWSP